MALIFIITFLILTYINYLIGIMVMCPKDVRKWKEEWIPFLISEIIVLIGTFFLVKQYLSL